MSFLSRPAGGYSSVVLAPSVAKAAQRARAEPILGWDRQRRDEFRKKRHPNRQLVQHDVLAELMGAVAHRAKAIHGGHPHCSCEVGIRRPSPRHPLEIEPKVAANLSGPLEELNEAGDDSIGGRFQPPRQ